MSENTAVVQERKNPILLVLGWIANLFGFSSKYYAGSKKRKKLTFDILTYIVLLSGSIIMIYPFWWMVAASFAGDSISMNTTILWPSLTTWGAGPVSYTHLTLPTMAVV